MATKATLKSMFPQRVTKKTRTRMCITDSTSTSENFRLKSGVQPRSRVPSKNFTRHGSSWFRQRKICRDKSRTRLAQLTLNKFSRRACHKTITKTAPSFSPRLATRIAQQRWDFRLSWRPTLQVQKIIAVTTTGLNATQPGSLVCS